MSSQVNFDISIERYMRLPLNDTKNTYQIDHIVLQHHLLKNQLKSLVLLKNLILYS